MAQKYRAFTEQFARHLNQHGWPLGKNVQTWFREQSNGIKTEKYTQLKRGQVVAERFSSLLVQMLQRDVQGGVSDNYSKAFVSYLKDHGIDAATAPMEQIIDCVCGPFADRPTEGGAIADFLQRGVDAVSDLFRAKQRLERHIQACASENQVREAVRWIFVAVARCMAKNGERLTIDEAIRAAAEIMHIEAEDYQRSAVEWWKFNPWTVLLTRGAKRPTGVAIVLPLAANGYEEIIGGRQMPQHTTPSQLCVPTSTLYFEAIAERPAEMGAEPGDETRVTRRLFAAVLAQSSVLSRSLVSPKSGNIKFVSFAGTPTNVKRLKSYGFRQTGKYMQHVGAEFLEREWLTSELRFPDTLLMSMMNYLGWVLEEPPSP
jgi:hypothetical protein